MAGFCGRMEWVLEVRGEEYGAGKRGGEDAVHERWGLGWWECVAGLGVDAREEVCCVDIIAAFAFGEGSAGVGEEGYAVL